MTKIEELEEEIKKLKKELKNLNGDGININKLVRNMQIGAIVSQITMAVFLIVALFF